MGQSLSKDARNQLDYPQSSGLPSFAKESPLNTAVFHSYHKLPFELKIMIWEHAFEPRQVRLWGQWIPNYLSQSNDAATSRYVIRSSVCNPAALSVDSETRGIGLRFYRPIQFRCDLNLAEVLALRRARHPNAASSQCWLWDISLVSDSLAFFNARVGDTMTIDLANQNAYHVRLSPKSIGLDFSFPEDFQLLRLKRRSYHTDRVCYVLTLAHITFPLAYYGTFDDCLGWYTRPQRHLTNQV